MKNLMILIICIGFMSSLFAQIKVYNISDSNFEIKENMYVYSLPKALIEIKIQVKTQCFFPGPFSKYAEKYLIIKDVKTEYDEFSDITNIEIIPKYIPDFNASFVVKSKKKPKIYLNNTGIISSYGIQKQEEKSLAIENNLFNNSFDISYFDFPRFTDLTVKRNFSNITDTTYKVIQIDSIYQKIPVYNTSITSKDFEQKAEEAANFIIKIRKRKFKLMAGMFEWENPPIDLALMISKLEELEKEYLSLFIGKVEYRTQEYSFEIIPDENLASQEIKLFKLDEDDTNPVQVYLEIVNAQKYSKLADFYRNKLENRKQNKKKGLFYRIPGNAKISLKADDKVYYENDFIMPQFGYIDFLPSKLCKKKKIKIIFNENYGSIQSISNE